MTTGFRAAFPLLVALSLGACRDTLGGPEPVDGEFSAVLVYGFVSDTDGAPVGNASVRLEARLVSSCSGLRDGTTVVTNGAGRYSAVLGNCGRSFDACVRVWATPALDLPLARDSASHSPVRFQTVWGDSVRIDVVLPPAAAP
jgi:hypothetical protein